MDVGWPTGLGTVCGMPGLACFALLLSLGRAREALVHPPARFLGVLTHEIPAGALATRDRTGWGEQPSPSARHPIHNSHPPPPTPIVQPAKAKSVRGLDQLTTDLSARCTARCYLLELNRPRARGYRPTVYRPTARLRACPPAIAPSLAEDSQPSLNPRGASLTQRPLSSTKTLLSLDDSARPTGYHYVDFVLSGSPCIPPHPGH